MKVIRYIVIILMVISSLKVNPQNSILLYGNNCEKGDLESSREDSIVETLVFNVSISEMICYFPEEKNKNGASVVICPGGGYEMLLIKREGVDIAKAFNEVGVAAFVLKYRLPDGDIKNKSYYPLMDVQKAFIIIRDSAMQWGIDPDRIGIMGFSAGGHLAATAGTHFNMSFVENERNINLHPDFMILINPVISMDESITHKGSRNRLLGNVPDKEKIWFYSNELHISSFTPPTYINHAKDDSVVSIRNSLLLYQSLKNNRVPVELEIYEQGGHGYLKKPKFDEWFSGCMAWIKKEGIIP
jgi:acetyl esterase/lipase